MKALRWIALVPIVFALLPASGWSQIKAVSLVQSLPQAIAVCAPTGETSRLFIAGQKGQIWVLKDGTLLPNLFLDLTGEVLTIPSGYTEQGLLGMTFHPNYATNGYFYVNFTAGTGNGRTVIRRYTVSSNPDSADENSGHTILEISQPSVSHNAGNLLFGPDDYLWVATGDGAGDPAVAQDPQSLLGKMLRLDADGDDFPAEPLRNYAIPPDNPFVADSTTADEIYALGLRNPWRYSFDRLTGDLYIGDVGWNTMEEVDFVPAGDPGGMNFGWNVMEGDSCNIPQTNCDDGSFTHPIHTLLHGSLTTHAVVAGYVYRGSALTPWLNGHFFFADWANQGLWSFRYENGMVTEFTNWVTELDVGGALAWPVSFWEDDQGELYVVDHRLFTSVGGVWKIVPDSSSVGIELTAQTPAPGLRLGRPHPNPFSGTTRFEVVTSATARLDVGVYDTAGRLLRRLHEGVAPRASMQMTWDGRDSRGAAVASGVYFLRARAGEAVSSRRVAITR